MTGPVGDNQTVTQAQVGLKRVQAIITEEHILGRVYNDDFLALQDAVPDRGNLLPGTLRAALQGENPFRTALSRLITPIIAGGAQWDGDETFPDAAQNLLKRLAVTVPDLAKSLALYGKAALFPHFGTVTDEEPTLTVLTGTLYPVADELRAGALERLLVFTPREGEYGKSYAVTEYAPGWVRRYADTVSPATFAQGRVTSRAEQRHVPDRLPVAYRTYEQDHEGYPTGPGHHALCATRRFVARLAQENIVYHASAGPQRVVTGDVGGTGNLNIGPYKVVRLPLGADFKIVGPDVAALSQHTSARQGSATDVLMSAGSPEGFVGAGESGESRAIAGQMHEQTSARIATLVAEILTDAALLLFRLGLLPNPVTFTVKPSFPAKRTAEQANIIQMYGAGIFSRYEALLRLQDAGVAVTDAELKRAKLEQERLESDPTDEEVRQGRAGRGTVAVPPKSTP